MSYGRSRRPASLDSIGQRRHKPDYWLVTLCVALLSIGLIVIYAISPGLSVQKQVSESYFINKQLVAVALGAAAFFAASNLPLKVWRQIETPLLVIAGISALAVRVVGEQVNGAYRWIHVGGLSFQPAELIKLVIIFWVAGFISDRMRKGELTDNSKTMKPLLIMSAVVALVVAKLQSDLGSTAVIIAIIGLMIYVAGLPMKRLLQIGAVVLVGMVILLTSSAYRRQRVMTYLHPGSDCLNTGYQVCQSLISVGSGGLFGLGLGRSVQAFGYQPEAANDSIFAIYAEKFGLAGTLVMIGLFMALFVRLKHIMERAPDLYSRLIVTGVLAWLSTQTVINVGAMIGLLPLKGITLPFVSYGGTSILFVMAAIGVVFQISRYTTYVVSSDGTQGKANDYSSDRRRLRGAYHPTPGSR